MAIIVTDVSRFKKFIRCYETFTFIIFFARFCCYFFCSIFSCLFTFRFLLRLEMIRLELMSHRLRWRLQRVTRHDRFLVPSGKREYRQYHVWKVSKSKLEISKYLVETQIYWVSEIWPFKIRTFWRLDFKGSGFNNGCSYSPNHSKTGPYEIQTFWLDFKWFLTKWQPFVQNSNGWAWDFRSHSKSITMLDPSYFQPVKIRLYQGWVEWIY